MTKDSSSKVDATCDTAPTVRAGTCLAAAYGGGFETNIRSGKSNTEL